MNISVGENIALDLDRWFFYYGTHNPPRRGDPVLVYGVVAGGRKAIVMTGWRRFQWDMDDEVENTKKKRVSEWRGVMPNGVVSDIRKVIAWTSPGNLVINEY